MDQLARELTKAFKQGFISSRQYLAGISGYRDASELLADLIGPGANMGPFGHPTYSMNERDRRWRNVCSMMEQQGLDCLILPHATADGHLQYAGYLSNGGFSHAPGAVIFPLKGDPSIIGSPMKSPEAWITEHHEMSTTDGSQILISDHIINRINELGLANGNIGAVGTIAGCEGLNEFINEGLVNYATWQSVLKGLPNALFKDITPEFAELIMVKGEEEIANFEKAAIIGEGLHRVMLDSAEIGVSDRRFRADIAEYLVLNNATADVQALFLPPGNLQDGMVINSEFGIIYSGGYAQVTMCMVLGSINEQVKELAEVAHASLEYGKENLKPGARFGDVVDGMEKIVFDAGYWHGFPQVHSLCPMFMVAPVYNDAPSECTPSKTLGADVIVKEGMIFSFEPGAKKGKGPMALEVKAGGTALVTKDGVRMFNTIGQRMQQI